MSWHSGADWTHGPTQVSCTCLTYLMSYLPMLWHFCYCPLASTLTRSVPHFSDCAKMSLPKRHTGLTHHLYFLTFGHSGAQSWAPECPNVKKNLKAWVRPVWPEHFKCNRLTPLGLKRLTVSIFVAQLNFWRASSKTCYCCHTSIRLSVCLSVTLVIHSKRFGVSKCVV